jgi:dTDP-4-amino-4,6-dideoxygalactose transaminase
MTVDVPFVDLRVQARELHDEFDRALWSVIDRGAFTLGSELAAFEASFAAFCGCDHAVGVSSGTDAVKLALVAAGVAPGDEVLVPVNTFTATAEAVAHVGARPVFVDCLEDTALIDPAALQTVAAEHAGKATAVVPVHLYGRACDMAAVQDVATRFGLALVEDACQAHGARYRGRPCGSMGVTAAFSFYPGKNLGALGDGGAVTTQDADVAERLRRLRNHGQADKYTHAVIGYCDRLHNLQAAVLSVKLARLGEWNERRRAAARLYEQTAKGLGGLLPISSHDDAESVFHLYVVRLVGSDAARRDAVRERLAASGVECGVHYRLPLHLQPAWAHLGYRPGDFPVAERLAGEILSLPMFPEIRPDQQEFVVSELALALEETA